MRLKEMSRHNCDYCMCSSRNFLLKPSTTSTCVFMIMKVVWFLCMHMVLVSGEMWTCCCEYDFFVFHRKWIRMQAIFAHTYTHTYSIQTINADWSWVAHRYPSTGWLGMPDCFIAAESFAFVCVYVWGCVVYVLCVCLCKSRGLFNVWFVTNVSKAEEA